MKLIDKDALVAEITKRRRVIEERLNRNNSYSEAGNFAWERDKALYDSHTNTLSFLDTLEVKEADLENIAAAEWDDYIRKIDGELNNAYMLIERNEYISLAKHFFELGLSASEPTTAADKGTAEEIIINLKRVENDYRIDLTKEIEWVRNKAQKGE